MFIIYSPDDINVYGARGGEFECLSVMWLYDQAKMG